MNESVSPVVITTTAKDRDTLQRIASALLEKKLAACCQISGPVDSLYRWQDKIESAAEYVVSVKTMSALAENVMLLIRAMHSYDEPELIITPILGGSPTYLLWLAENCDTTSPLA